MKTVSEWAKWIAKATTWADVLFNCQKCQVELAHRAEFAIARAIEDALAHDGDHANRVKWLAGIKIDESKERTDGPGKSYAKPE